MCSFVWDFKYVNTICLCVSVKTLILWNAIQIFFDFFLVYNRLRLVFVTFFLKEQLKVIWLLFLVAIERIFFFLQKKIERIFLLVTAEAANSYKKYNCLCFNYLSPVMDSTDPNHHSSFNSNTRDEDKEIFGNHTKYKS